MSFSMTLEETWLKGIIIVMGYGLIEEEVDVFIFSMYQDLHLSQRQYIQHHQKKSQLHLEEVLGIIITISMMMNMVPKVEDGAM